MQGKDNHQFDQGFIDKQWTEMETLLDQSLPTKLAATKSNKSSIIILSLLLLLTTLSTIFYAYKYNTIEPVTELITEKVVYKNIVVEQPVEAEIAEITLPSPSPIKNKLYPDSFVEGLINENANLQKIIADYKATQLSKKTDASSQPVNHFADAMDALNTVPLILSEIEYSEEVESGLYFDDNAFLIEEEGRKTEYNVGVLASATTDLDYTGMGIVSGVRFPLGKKLGLNTGVAISYLDRDHLFIPDFIRGSSETLTDPKNAQTYYEGLKNLKQVYVPLNINYNLSDAWVINSGFKFRYTYSETVDEDLPLPSARPTRKPIENHESIFNNANIGLSAGLEYHLNTNFSLQLDSEWGMSSLINRSQFSTAQTRYDLNMVNLSTHFKF